MRIALLAAAALLIPASAAQADAPGSWQQKALGVAQVAWHPACGTLALRFSDPAAALVVDDAPSRAGQVVDPATVLGFTATGSCELGISSRIDWRHRGYPAFCSTVLHEAGRAAGAHGTDSEGVMSTVSDASRDVSRVWRHGHWRARVIWSGVDRRCIRPMDRRLPRHH